MQIAVRDGIIATTGLHRNRTDVPVMKPQAATLALATGPK
jgi:hypothetical protein